MEFQITLEKFYQRKRKDLCIYQKQLNKIAGIIKHDWNVSVDLNPVSNMTDKGMYRYFATLKINNKRVINDLNAQEKFVEMETELLKRAAFMDWFKSDSKPENTPAPSTSTNVTGVSSGASNLQLGELPELTPEVISKYFGDIYEREPHIRTIYASLRTAKHSNFEKRRHVLLEGPPAAAKTKVFMGFEKWLGERWVKGFDATTMSKAGFEITIMRLSREGMLPPVIYLEEIEKCNPVNLPCLLGMMDQRGRIQRTLARGNNTGIFEAKEIIWATCNNLKFFATVQGGALASRFSWKLRCCRPSKNLMKHILIQEAKDIGLTNSLAEKIVPKVQDYLFGVMKTNDPREGVALLDYGAQWLHGVPQDLIDIKKAAEEEEKFIKEMSLNYEGIE